LQRLLNRMTLTPKISKRNFYSLLWHAAFLALSRPFMDTDTVIPSMLVDAGGTAVQIGIMTAIMLGGSSITQLIFAPFISNYHYKRNFLLLGINLRIFALLGMGLMLFYSAFLQPGLIIWLIFLLISIFSLSGAFANVSYMDIFGKSVLPELRKPFFSLRQAINGIVLFMAALAAKRVLTTMDYPRNYAIMYFIAFGATHQDRTQAKSQTKIFSRVHQHHGREHHLVTVYHFIRQSNVPYSKRYHRLVFAGKDHRQCHGSTDPVSAGRKIQIPFPAVWRCTVGFPVASHYAAPFPYTGPRCYFLYGRNCLYCLQYFDERRVT